MKKILFHVCCAPCMVAPYNKLRDEGEVEISAFWFNDNIHPYKEYEARLDTLIAWSEKIGLSLEVEDSYLPYTFMHRINEREHERCYFCYHFRLLKTAEKAKREGFDAFSTSLLYSKFQKHQLTKMIAENISDRLSIPFYYRDFRDLWYEGKKLSLEENMYRQKYCGCLYSEMDRWYKPAKVKGKT